MVKKTMADFSKYLGKEERVLNSIDMKDETIWSQNNNVVTSEYKSWTTLVVTNKRLFSLSKRKLSMREFRLEDIVSTGWVYRPQLGKIVWGIFYLILAALVFAVSGAIGSINPIVPHLVQFIDSLGLSVGADILTLVFVALALLIVVFAIMEFISYLLFKRTTLTISTKDGREYKFLLRGRRNHIDDFRMAIQDARDLYIEETENRYFDKMRTVLFEQSNYEYALNKKAGATPVGGSETEKLKREEYLLWERKNAQLSGTPEREQIGMGGQNLLPASSMQLNEDGTLMLESGGEYLLKSSDDLSVAPLAAKAADLFEQMGFEVSKLSVVGADMLLYKDNLRYIVVVDKDEFGAITNEKIQKAIDAKNTHQTDFGLFISAGDMTNEIQEYANSNDVKIVYIKKTE